MGKTWRRKNSDDEYFDVRRARQSEDEFHSRRAHTREIEEISDVETTPKKPNKKFDAFRNIKG